MDGALLRAAIDALLPGDGVWPGAAVLDLADEISAIAARQPNGAALLDRVEAALADDFVAASASRREAALRVVEADDPAAFQLLVLAAYTAYYTDARVLRVIAAVTGLAARPPQPAGNDLAPFDPTSLSTMRTRPPLWRPAP